MKTDGSVVAVGSNSYHQCELDSWTDILQVTGGSYHSVGLKEDGTVIALGRTYEGQCDVDDWDLDGSALPGDITGDGDVDGKELCLLALKFGTMGCGECPEDLNGDGNVDIADLDILAAFLGSVE